MKEGETLMIDYKRKTAELILEKSPSLAGELSVTDIAQAIEVPSDKRWATMLSRVSDWQKY